MSPLPEEKVEALAAERFERLVWRIAEEGCIHVSKVDHEAVTGCRECQNIADNVAPLVTRWLAEAEAVALLSAAREARERGDIGKDGGPEAWVWLEALGCRAEHPQDRCDLFRTPMGRCTCGGDS